MTVKKMFHTKDGVVERELTNEEVIQFAKMGDAEARQEVFSKKWLQVTTSTDKLELIKRILAGEDI